MTEYRTLHEPEINRTLFQDFIRRQVVTKCWRREHGQWIIKDAPFIDDWTEEDYLVLIDCLKHTISTGGLVHGAFVNHSLKGFVAVLPEIFGGENQYMDLAAIHVSQDMRNSGIGKALFLTAKQWAKEKGAKSSTSPPILLWKARHFIKNGMRGGKSLSPKTCGRRTF